MAKGLGRGLEALIPGGTVPSGKKEGITTIGVEKIRPNRYQSRIKFDKTKLKELSESIKQKGIIQPLVVSPSVVPGEYELIAGERRLRAAKLVRIKQVPVVVRQVNEEERFQLSLIENIQREDLNPVEQASAYRNILQEFKLTQEELSKIISKDRSVIANTLRLLNLPAEIQDMISGGIISAGHARTLSAIENKTKQKELANRILKEKLTVRETEKIIQTWKSVLTKKRPLKKSPEIVSLEEKLQQILGTRVELKTRGKKGKIIIFFYSLDDIDRLINLFKGKK